MGHEMRLNDNELSHFGIAKSFTNNDNKINSLDFFNDGKHLVTAGDDDAITIYDSENGKRKQTLYSKSTEFKKSHTPIIRRAFCTLQQK